MTCRALPSEHIAEIRNRLKDYVHEGKYFSSDEVISLIRRMNTIEALAEEVEEENRLLGRHVQATARPIAELLIEPAGNVIAFPRRPAEPPRGGGGGSAA